MGMETSRSGCTLDNFQTMTDSKTTDIRTVSTDFEHHNPLNSLAAV